MKQKPVGTRLKPEQSSGSSDMLILPQHSVMP